MKFGKEACMVGMGALVGLGAIRSSKADNSIRGQQRRSLTTIGECVVAIADVQGVDEKDEFRVACETEDGNMYDVDGLSSDFVRGSVMNGNLAPGDVIPSLNGKPVGLDGKIRSSSAAPGIEKRNEAANKRGRRLAIVEGDRTVLAVMVTTSDAAYSRSASQLEDDVFIDSRSLATQYFACSHGKLNFIRAPDRTGSNTNILNGIVAITVAESSSQTDSVVRPAVTSKLNSEFGVSSPTQLANHVMYCLPPGTMSGIAYAYINSWNSVYSDLWCNYVSAQLHELGHNLNLAHSGEGAAYDDQSGMMGFSYSQDDGPVMCFNNAKNYQLGWFDGAVVVLSSPGSYIGPLKGQVNYVSGSDPVVIKIETGFSNDYYVGFNHRVKHNSGTVEGGNQVTIQEQGGEGNSYATSTLKAKLSAGQSWTSPALSDGKRATVTVNSIDTATDTGFALVDISVGGCTGNADCDDGDACTVNTCDTGTGTCSSNPIDCDDGDACTIDSCNGGTCSNTQISCDDGNACTTDVCDAGTGACSNNPVTCTGGDLCNTATCDPAVGCGLSPNCDDSNSCTLDECNPVDGTCSSTPLDPCCGDGICAGGTAEDCNSCPQDCASGTFGGSTPNNGICEFGEDCNNTPNDCPGNSKGGPSSRYCCAGDPTGVANGEGCDANGQCRGMECDSTPSVSGSYCCGDGTCAGPETYELCNTADCNAPAPTDAPVPTPAPVFVPTPAPVPVPTPAPVACGGRNAPCNAPADCCNSCKGNGKCS